jgi:hypothetical protein
MHSISESMLSVCRVDQPITTGPWVDGLRGQLVPFDLQVLTTGAMWRRYGDVYYETRIVKRVSCYPAQVRALKHNELDPSVIAELDAVITKMTLLLETEGQFVVVDRVLTERILTTIGRVAVCLDWVRRISQQFLE